MATSGEATGGNDVFNGKNRIFWALISQDMTAGGHGSSLITWLWCVNWAAGDNCHTILNGHVAINAVNVYPITPTVHSFNGSHVHVGDWPRDSGFGSGFLTIFHDASGNASITMAGYHEGTSGAGSASSGTWALPQIPQTVTAPSGATATRVNDGQATVSWTNNGTSTAPYANLKVYRSTDGGGWALIATLGFVSTYTDTTISANHKYAYRVSAVGANGIEVGYATAAAIWTTPGAPTSCAATKQPSNDVLVTWANHVNFSEYTTRIEESTNGGSSWTEIGSVASGVTSYTHTAPSTATTHVYRVRARTSSGTTLNSSYSANSGTVTLLATANPPTGLSPSGTGQDAAGAIVLSWTHNPADGTPQSKRRVQYKIDAGSFVDAVNDSSNVSSYTLPAGTLTNGHTITWRVATAGQNGTLSAFSAEASFTTSAKPTATIATPGGTFDSSHLVATWTYFQAQGSAQATYVAQLYDAASVLLEQVTGTTTASADFATALADGATYTVKVTVTSAVGLASATASQAFTVAFLPPAAVAIAASYDADAGTTVVTLVGDEAEPGVTEVISTVDVHRQIDGGPWLVVATGIVLDAVTLTATIADTTPTIVGTNTYRAVAHSALPSSAVSATVDVVTAEKAWCFLSYGPGFGTLCRFRATPTLVPTVGRARALYNFAGREDPVQFSGRAVAREVSVTGQLRRNDGSSTPEEFEAAGGTDGIVLWRDPTGRRMFASISPVQTPRSSHITAQVTFTVTKIAYSEAVA